MISLFLDTCLNRLIIGIYKDKKQIYLKNEKVNNDLSSKVLPYIKEALESLNLSVDDIGEIYVVNGPGSFTGIRVGVTVAKTLAWSKKINIYTLSELQVMASGTKKRYTLSLIDARRGYVYAGMYNKNLKVMVKDEYIKLEDLIKKLKKEYKLSEIDFVSYDKIDKASLPEIDIEKVFNKLKFTSIDPHNVNPNYLKKTEAEEKLNDKKNK